MCIGGVPCRTCDSGQADLDATGKGTTPTIAASSTAQLDFNARLGTNFDCKSCKSQKCTITAVTDQ